MITERNMRVLEFTKIRDLLAEGALTETGAEKCRALTPMDNLAEVQAAQDETEEAGEAIRKLGGEITEVKRYSLPGGDKRTLAVIKKVSPTPPQYPRVSAKIAKKPL